MNDGYNGYNDNNNNNNTDANGAPQYPGSDNGTGSNNGTGANSGMGAENGDYSQYGGNVQYKWNYDDYQKALSHSEQQQRPPRPPKKKNRGLRAFLISVGSIFLVAIVGLAGVGVAYMVKDGKLSGAATGASQSGVKGNGPSLKLSSKPAASSAVASSATTDALAMTPSQVVKKVSSSVVGIVTYDLQSVDPTAEGSGIIMNANGYIITNQHVISGARKVQVVTSDNKSYDAKVVGSDARTDLAVLKIEATGLTAATFGNSSQIEVGEQVIAIGNPGGLEFSGSVTGGMISAVNRSITTESGYSETAIQTDAPINPGNSGGALVNMYGQVIGITSEKISETGYEGMGFAIPINSAKPIVDDLINYGYVKNRVKIGISVTPFDSYQASIYNMPQGLLVTAVNSNSDAYAKGVKQDDIITKINNVAATDYDTFYKEESKYKPGDTVTLTVYRYSTKSTLTITVKLLEDKGTDSTGTTTQQQQQPSSGYGNRYNQSYGGSSAGSSDNNNGV